jgi:hypothetical protein
MTLGYAQKVSQDSIFHCRPNQRNYRILQKTSLFGILFVVLRFLILYNFLLLDGAGGRGPDVRNWTADRWIEGSNRVVHVQKFDSISLA